MQDEETNLSNERAQRILDAAEELMLEDGGASASAVAKRAGVNKALVFYYFGSTHALFAQVLERYYARHKATLAEAVQEGTLEERLHRVVDALFDSMGESPAYPRLVQQQVAGRGEHFELVKAHLSDVLSWTEEMLGGLLPDEGPTAVHHFHLSLAAVVINFFTYGPVFDLDVGALLDERRAHVHWLVDAWLLALRNS